MGSMSQQSNMPSTRSDDRIFVLEKIDNKAPKDSIGMTDHRLFTGENRLHAVKNHETNMWYFKLDKGGVPEPMKCMFTGFKDARKFAESYYATRNIKITEVID